MARPDSQSVRLAKANVKRWFTETQLGTAFLPGDGNALPLGKDEAQAIRASAEANIVKTAQEVHNRTVVKIIVIVVVIAATFSLKRNFPPGWHTAIDVVAYLLYAGHGLSIAYDYWRWERTIFLLRESIAHSLRTRISLPPEIAGPLARQEPNYRLLHSIVFGLLAITLIVEIAPMVIEKIVGPGLAEDASGWIMAIAYGGIAAVLAYVLGDIAMRKLSNAASKHGPRR